MRASREVLTWVRDALELLAGRGAQLLASAGLGADVALTLTVAGLVRLSLALLKVSTNTFGNELVMDGLLLLACVPIFHWARRLSIRSLIRQLSELTRYSSEPRARFLHALATQRISETLAFPHSLEREGFYASTPQEISQLCSLLFEYGGQPYFSTDSHAPS